MTTRSTCPPWCDPDAHDGGLESRHRSEALRVAHPYRLFTSTLPTVEGALTQELGGELEITLDGLLSVPSPGGGWEDTDGDWTMSLTLDDARSLADALPVQASGEDQPDAEMTLWTALAPHLVRPAGWLVAYLAESEGAELRGNLLELIAHA